MEKLAIFSIASCYAVIQICKKLYHCFLEMPTKYHPKRFMLQNLTLLMVFCFVELIISLFFFSLF